MAFREGARSRDSAEKRSPAAGKHLCEAPGPIFLSGIDYLPAGVTLTVELACVAYLAILCGLELGFGRPKDAQLRLRLLATGLMAMDVVIFGLCVVAFDAVPGFRLAP